MTAAERPPAVWLDHFVVAIRDLDTGMSAFEALTGVCPAYGGEHPSLGTHNALVSLGANRYLEILAPRPGAVLDPFFGAASRYETLTPILWAVATDDLDSVYQSITAAGFAASEPSLGSRRTDDGDTIRWSMITMGDAAPAVAPFCIQWTADTRHPSLSSPAGCSLASFTARSPDDRDLGRLLGLFGFPLTVNRGSAAMIIDLESPNGPVRLGASTDRDSTGAR